MSVLFGIKGERTGQISRFLAQMERSRHPEFVLFHDLLSAVGSFFSKTFHKNEGWLARSLGNQVIIDGPDALFTLG